jgi:hypothetical protein
MSTLNAAGAAQAILHQPGTWIHRILALARGFSRQNDVESIMAWSEVNGLTKPALEAAQ